MIKCKAFAPATVANVIVGFDLLGFALHELGDTVTVKKIDDPAVRINSITAQKWLPEDTVGSISNDPEQNTATVGLLKLRSDLNLKHGFEVEIEKGIPLGSGMGGSAASAVAAVVAANALLQKPLSREALIPYATEGEFAASGSRHADNVAPCLIGGLTLVTANGITRIPVPEELSIAIIYPGFRLDTRQARAVLPKEITLKKHVEASGRLAAFVGACYRRDIDGLRNYLNDDIIEPARAPLIKGFRDIKSAALESGALGASIAGAGPSMLAICKSQHAPHVLEAMLTAARANGHKASRGWSGSINDVGARVLE